MLLSEALNERADLQKRIEQLGSRLNANAKVQEGDEPSEAPEELMTELDDAILRLEALIKRINQTNSVTVDGETTLTGLLAKRDALALKNRIYRDFLGTASDRLDRYSSSEIRIHSTVDVRSLQKRVDQSAKALRELDIRIQRLNWSTELI